MSFEKAIVRFFMILGYPFKIINIKLFNAGIYAIEQLSPNELCHCKSGKKYKDCCLNYNNQAGLVAYKFIYKHKNKTRVKIKVLSPDHARSRMKIRAANPNNQPSEYIETAATEE